MNEFGEPMSIKTKRRITLVVFLILAVIFSVVLYNIATDYHEKENEKSDELALLDSELHTDIGNQESDPEKDKELAEKMKNYNFYQKLKERLDVNILFLGNESAAGTKASNWPIILKDELLYTYRSNVKGATYAISGTDTFFGYHMMNVGDYLMNSLKRRLVYDLVVISYGKGEDPETFEFFYDGLVRSVKHQNPKCELICIIEASSDGKNENGEKIREICEYYGGICLDMNEYFAQKRANLKTALKNGNVPTDEGNKLYFSLIDSVIADNYNSERIIPEITEPRIESSEKFENYRFVDIADMKKVSDTVYEITVSESIASLFFYNSYSGDRINVYLNGKKIITQNNKQSNNSVRQIDVILISSELEGTNKIRIETRNETNMSNILGVALSGK